MFNSATRRALLLAAVVVILFGLCCSAGSGEELSNRKWADETGKPAKTTARLINYGHQPVGHGGAIDTAARALAINRQTARAAQKHLATGSRVKRNDQASCRTEEECEIEEEEQENLASKMEELRGNLFEGSNKQKGQVVGLGQDKVEEERNVEEKSKGQKEKFNAGLKAKLNLGLENPGFEFSTGIDLGKEVLDKIKLGEEEKKGESFGAKLGDFASSAKERLEQFAAKPRNSDESSEEGGDFSNPLEKVGNFVRDPLGQVKNHVENNAGGGGGLITTPIEAIKEVHEIPKKIVGGIKDKLEHIAEVPKKIVGDIKEKVEKIAEIPREIANGIKEKVEAIGEVKEKVIEGVEDKIEHVHEGVEDIVEDKVELVEKKLDVVRDVVEEKEKFLEDLPHHEHHHHKHPEHHHEHHHEHPKEPKAPQKQPQKQNKGHKVKHHHHHHHHYPRPPPYEDKGAYGPSSYSVAVPAPPAYASGSSIAGPIAYSAATPNLPAYSATTNNNYKLPYYQPTGSVAYGDYAARPVLPVKLEYPIAQGYKPQVVNGLRPSCVALSGSLKKVFPILLQRLIELEEQLQESDLSESLVKSILIRLAKLKLGIEDLLELLEANEFDTIRKVGPSSIKLLIKLSNLSHIAKLDPLLKPMVGIIRIIFANQLVECKY